MSLARHTIAVVGASGNVGRSVLRILSEYDVPVSHVTALASSRSQGKQISYGEDHTITIETLTEETDFSAFNIVFFAAGSKISMRYALKAVDAGCFVIDKSSHFRTDPISQLVVSEVNPHDIPAGAGLVSIPNCNAIPLAIVLNALQETGNTIERCIVSTYQSVSGAGFQAMQILDRQTREHHLTSLGMDATETPIGPFPKPIAFNVIPHIDELDPEQGDTLEERKMISEIDRILQIPLAATCVRVPVFLAHSMSVHVTFEDPISIDDARSALENESAIILDEPHTYTTPLDGAHSDFVHVSRIRHDPTHNRSLMLWIVCDNLRKGAALSGVQIADIWAVSNQSKR